MSMTTHRCYIFAFGKTAAMAAKLPIDTFTAISFTHHMEILSKTNSLEDHVLI